MEPNGTKSILAIEDNAGDARLIENGFKSFSGKIDLRVARDGKEGLAVLFKPEKSTSPFSPMAVLLDLNLPDQDGFSVLQQVRSHPSTALIPVIIFSSSNAQDQIDKAYQRGANAFVTKPSDPERYIEAIKNIGSFWLDTASRPGIRN